MTQPGLRMSQLVAYGLVAVPLAIAGLPLAIYVPPFYASDVGIELAMVGVVLMLARVTDVIVDPLIGTLSDRWRTPFGRRRPWLVVGAIVMMIGAWKLFVPPPGVGAVYLLVWVFTLYLGWSLVSIPHFAWGAELSTDYHVRSRITGAREMCMVFGLILAAIVPYAIGLGGGSGLGPGMRALATLTVVLFPIVLALVLTVVPEPPPVEATRRLAWREGLAIVWQNGPFKRLLLASVIGGFGTSINQSLAVLFYVHRLGLRESAAGFILLYFIAGILAVPFWVAVSKRLTKHRTLVVASLWACSCFLLAPFLPPGRILPVALLNVMAGLSMAVPQVLGGSMAADVVDLDTLESGEGRAALFFALWSMGTKLALALGVGVGLPVLALFGFDPKAANGPSEIAALTTLYCIVPVGLWLLALVPIWHFPITPARHAELREALLARRAEVA